MVNFTGLDAFNGADVMSSATEMGLVGLTRGIAREYGKYNITANCIGPGSLRFRSLRPEVKEYRLGNCAEEDSHLLRFSDLQRIRCPPLPCVDLCMVLSARFLIVLRGEFRPMRRTRPMVWPIVRSC